jgi:hypothetical protein
VIGAHHTRGFGSRASHTETVLPFSPGVRHGGEEPALSRLESIRFLLVSSQQLGAGGAVVFAAIVGASVGLVVMQANSNQHDKSIEKFVASHEKLVETHRADYAALAAAIEKLAETHRADHALLVAAIEKLTESHTSDSKKLSVDIARLNSVSSSLGWW